MILARLGFVAGSAMLVCSCSQGAGQSDLISAAQTTVTVTSTVSTAPDKIVPDVVGLAIVDAGPLLADEGWAIETEDVKLADLDPDEPGSPGMVVAQSEPAGSEVSSPGTLRLSVIPDYVILPNVHDLTRDEAYRLLRDFGLVVEVEMQNTYLKPSGVVLRSYPGRGKLVMAGATVRIFVAIEPEPVTHTAALHLEVRDYLWDLIGDAGCEHSYYNLSKGKTVQLIGPDGAVLSAQTLDAGRIDSDVCAWDVTFPDVPEVAAYSITVSSSDGGWPTKSLAEMRSQSWHFEFFVHSE